MQASDMRSSMVHQCFAVCMLLLAMCASVRACSCVETHPQQHVCSSDFVLKIKVKSSFSLNRKTIRLYDDKNETDVRPLWRVFKIKLIKPLKESSKFLQVKNPNLLYTSHSGSMCGAVLKAGSKYVISGSVRNGRLTLHMCNWIQLWDDTTRHQRKSLVLGMYEKACDCKVSSCYTAGCRRHLAADACMWQLPGYSWRSGQVRYDVCQAELAYCKRGARGDCQWNRSAALKSCYSQSKQP